MALTIKMSSFIKYLKAAAHQHALIKFDSFEKFYFKQAYLDIINDLSKKKNKI